MEKQQIGLITSVVVNVVLAALLIFFIFKLNASSGAVGGRAQSDEAKALLTPDLSCVNVNAGDALLIIDVQNDFMPERPYTPTGTPRNAPTPNDMNGNNLKGGSLAVPAAKDIVSHINPLIDTFEAAKGTIIYSLDWHPAGHCSFDPAVPATFAPVTPGTANICRDDNSTKKLNENSLIRWPVHCVQGSWGAQFDPHLKISTVPTSFVLKKGFWVHFDSYSAFGGRVSKFVPANDAIAVDSSAGWEDMTEATKRLTDILKERKIKRLFVVGIATDFCVRYSLEDAIIAEFSEIPGIAIATVKEAVGTFGTPGKVTPEETNKTLFDEWQKKGIAVLSEKNKAGKSLFSTSC